MERRCIGDALRILFIYHLRINPLRQHILRYHSNILFGIAHMLPGTTSVMVNISTYCRKLFSFFIIAMLLFSIYAHGHENLPFLC